MDVDAICEGTRDALLVVLNHRSEAGALAGQIAMVPAVHQQSGPADVLANNAGSLSAIGPIWEAPSDR